MKTPTAEEFLRQKDAISKMWTEDNKEICKGLEEYSSLRNAELIEENKRLREELYALKLMMALS